ncbi:MAG: hypothetical protein V3V33_11620 [Candidatus Lokiarchaeia archaeon]
MEKFELSKYLTLKLEDGKTNIYIEGELFLQCKSLMLNIPKNKIKELSSIKSIDEATEKLYYGRKGGSNTEIEPIDEFWAHCSNFFTSLLVFR